jgi:hypothetical protein
MLIIRHHKQRLRAQLDAPAGVTSFWFLLFIVAFLGWGVVLVASAENGGALDTSADRCHDDDQGK